MRKKIFILEDNDDLRQLFAIILEEENYEVETFSNVTQFYSNSTVPNLYLLDIMLPDGDGIDVCKKLKTDEHTASVPIIMMSAHKGETEVTNRCPEASFIAKPFDIEHPVSSIADRIK